MSTKLYLESCQVINGWNHEKKKKIFKTKVNDFKNAVFQNRFYLISFFIYNLFIFLPIDNTTHVTE